MSAATVLYLVGMGLLFVGERLLSTEPVMRAIVATLAALCLGGALALRLKARQGAGSDARRSGEGWAVAFTLTGIAALLLYALTLGGVTGALGLSEVSESRWRATFGALWPIVWLLGTLPLVLVDFTLGQMPNAVQGRRVRHAAEMGLSLALALCLVFPVNYLAARHNKTTDLRHLKTTAAGEATLALVEALSEPLDVYLFFPPASDVARELRPYFDALARASDLLRVEQVDHPLVPDLAEKLRVSANGSVALVRGEDVERINVGTELDRARSSLRRFDETFQGRLLQLTRRSRTVYFTVGHEEMHWSPTGDETPTRRLSGLKRVLEQLNFRVRDLGVRDGLGREIPDDAAAVIVAGPRQPFLPEEVASLEQYARRGGRLFILLEPGEERHASLAALAGVRFHDDLIHSDRHHLMRTRTMADRALLATNRFSSHPSVGTLSRHSSRMAIVLDQSGWLETQAGDGLRVSATVRSMPRSWADVVANHEFDADTERRESWDLGAAATRDLEDGTQYRAAILANSAAVSDAYLGNQANLQYAVDTLRWLTDDEDLTGLVEREEDVRIQHSRDQDLVWSYGTIFAVPLTVLVGGLLHVRRRRRRTQA
jgi:hypothetical protein